jgi:hypothetical protein
MNRKRELTDLAESLQAIGINPQRIGELLGYSGQHIRNILQGQGRPTRDRAIADILSRLPAQLRRRVESWRAARLVAKSKQTPL